MTDGNTLCCVDIILAACNCWMTSSCPATVTDPSIVGESVCVCSGPDVAGAV